MEVVNKEKPSNTFKKNKKNNIIFLFHTFSCILVLEIFLHNNKKNSPNLCLKQPQQTTNYTQRQTKEHSKHEQKPLRSHWKPLKALKTTLTAEYPSEYR